MKVITASESHLAKLTLLFDSYRVFYKQSSDLVRAEKFLSERFQKNDSVLFMAVSEEGEAMGFTQLYPSFSSVSTQPTYILNDLFVAAKHRKKGVGEALLERAKQFAINDGAKGITLETDHDNPAQKLYERLGWKKDTKIFHYTWEV
tara:strand:- start:14118 stop:14558 length:441 start_codon:yes stop_codon:yes gene_type:complete